MQAQSKITVDQIVSKGSPITVLRLSGDISSASRESIFGAWDSVSRALPALLDFSRVDYINSSGIALVIQILIGAGKSGQRVAIFGLSPHFQKVFTMVGIPRYAGLYLDEPTAAAAL